MQRAILDVLAPAVALTVHTVAAVEKAMYTTKNRAVLVCITLFVFTV